MSTSPVLITHDGSPDARADRGHFYLPPGANAVVLYARQPLESLAAHLEDHLTLGDVEKVDAATASDAVVAAAEEVDAALIVLGSHGRHGVRAALLGSTSTDVLHHARRPTLVIPSEAVVAERAKATGSRQ